MNQKLLFVEDDLNFFKSIMAKVLKLPKANGLVISPDLIKNRLAKASHVGDTVILATSSWWQKWNVGDETGQLRGCELLRPCLCHLLSCSPILIFNLRFTPKIKNPEKSFDFRLVHEVLLVDCIVNRLCHPGGYKSQQLCHCTIGDIWWHTVGDITYVTWHCAFVLDF